MAQKDMDPMLKFLKGSGNALIHRYERAYPYWIHGGTEPALKVLLNKFVTPSGENGWKFMTNAKLLPMQHTLTFRSVQMFIRKFRSYKHNNTHVIVYVLQISHKKPLSLCFSHTIIAIIIVETFLKGKTLQTQK